MQAGKAIWKDPAAPRTRRGKKDGFRNNARPGRRPPVPARPERALAGRGKVFRLPQPEMAALGKAGRTGRKGGPCPAVLREKDCP